MHVGLVWLRRSSALAFAVSLLLALAGSAQAAPLVTVTTTGDPGPAGTESLRQALVDVDPGGTITVPASASRYELALGTLMITKPLTIQGAGASSTVIDAHGASGVLHIAAGGSTAINGVTITGGAVSGSGGLVGGAGIYNTEGVLTLTGTTVTGNTANANGGNCCNGGAGIWTTGNITLTNSRVDGNTLTVIAGGFCCDGGGGLFQDGGAITLTNSSISNNTASVTGGTGNEGGGGFFEDGGNIALTSSSVSGNTLTLSGVPNNSGGGGFYQDGGTTTLTDSSVSHDTSSQTGAGVTSNNGGGGFFNDGGTLTLTRSTVGDDTATVTGTEFNGGGGIYHDGGTATFSNSTISANTANITGASTNGGGAVYIDSGAVTFTNSTVAANVASVPGGGLFNNSLTATTLQNTIVASNSAPSGANCSPAVSFSSLGNNIDSADTCNLTAVSDKKNTDPLLGPLQDNGGPTFTQALLPGSPAIDAGNNAACPATDQRGVPRPQPSGGICDIGAYEVGVADLALSASAAPDPVAVGGQLTYSATITNGGPTPTNTTLHVTLPNGVSLVSASASVGACTPSGSNVSCSLGALNPGASALATIIVSPSAAGPVTSTLSVSSSDPDPTPGDNTKTLTVTAVAVATSSTPILTAVKESATKWLEGNALARFSARRKLPIGTTFSFDLNESARVSFAFTQPASGRKVGKKCVAQTRQNKKKRRCTRTLTPATLSFTAHTGTNKVRFQGRISRSTKLKPGRYTLTIIATNPAGRRSLPHSLSFTIVKK
jgi:hypothetical protein